MFNTLQAWVLEKIGFKELASVRLFDLASEAYERCDYTSAAALLKRAAVLGHAIAQYNLAVMYDNGQGVDKNPQEAFEWYQRSANQGYEEAQFNMGVAYSIGEVVPVDYVQAIEWYHKAAAQGQSDAQNNLGVMYDNGVGVPQDFKKAERWYCFAIQHDNEHAQLNLGKKYARGVGVPQNRAIAYALFNLSHECDVEAEEEMVKLERSMSTQEVVQAKKIISQIERRGIESTVIMRPKKV